MKKTGTRQDTDQFHSRKDQVRVRLSKGASIGPLIFGPTALIVCPTSLIDNVSDLSQPSERHLLTSIYCAVVSRAGNSESQ